MYDHLIDRTVTPVKVGKTTVTIGYTTVNRGHVFKGDDDHPGIDIFAYEGRGGRCNGPECLECHKAVCHHCHPGIYVETCPARV